MAEEIAGKTVQVLDLMLKYFANERHWIKNNYRNGGSGRCLVGAAMHFSAQLGLPKVPVITLLEAALPQRQMGLVSFNDRCRTIGELRDLIRKARVLALENAEHERAAATLLRHFLAELFLHRVAGATTASRAPASAVAGDTAAGRRISSSILAPRELPVSRRAQQPALLEDDLAAQHRQLPTIPSIEPITVT